MLLISLLRGRFRHKPPFLTSLLTLLLLVLLPGPAQPISFQLPGKARKCLREEIHRDKLVTGEYEVAPPPGSSTGPSANLKVQGRRESKRGSWAGAREGGGLTGQVAVRKAARLSLKQG